MSTSNDEQTPQVFVLSADSSDTDTSLAVKCKDNGKSNFNLPPRAVSRQSLREREQPRPFCAEFDGMPHKNGTGCDENDGKLSADSYHVTRVTSHECAQSILSPPKNHGKKMAQQRNTTSIEINVFSLGSNEARNAATTQATSCDDNRQQNRSRVSRSQPGLGPCQRQRQKPRRFCEEFIGGPRKQKSPKRGRGSMSKPGKRSNDAHLNASIRNCTSLGAPVTTPRGLRCACNDGVIGKERNHCALVMNSQSSP